MTIKEMEALLNMPRANIRYYEQQGLLAPQRADNGYREYADEDVKALERVRLLRSLGCTVDEIRALQSGREKLNSILERKADGFSRLKSEFDTAKEMCEAILEEGVSYDTLDAKKYASGAWRAPALPKPPKPPIEAITFQTYPWRRFFARMLDLSLYASLWACLLALGFRVNLAIRESATGWSIVDTGVSLLLMLLFEPLFLRFAGTTPGKWIFGIRIENLEGGRLTLREARERTLGAIWRGLGWYIPVYCWVRLWKSWKATSEGDDLPWESESALTVRDTKPWRGFACVGACALLLASVYTAISFSQLPPNRSDLTIAQFAQNYNALAEYYGIDAYALDERGEWANEANDAIGSIGGIDIVISDSQGEFERPVLRYRLENGHIASVGFEIEQKGQEYVVLDTRYLTAQTQLCSLAFLGARLPVLSGERSKLIKAAELNYMEDAFAEFSCGEMRYDVELTGFDSSQPSGMLFTRENAEWSFRARFSLTSGE